MVYCGGNPFKLKEATETPIREMLHFIAYQSDLNKLTAPKIN